MMPNDEITELDLSKCIQCGRVYNWKSSPYWCFNEKLELVGTAHTSCCRAWGQKTLLDHWIYTYAITPSTTAETARRYAWLWTAKDAPQGRGASARMLFPMNTPEVERHLDHWVNGPMKLAPNRVPAIREELAAAQVLYLERFPEQLTLEG